jgi:hypothetical protein
LARAISRRKGSPGLWVGSFPRGADNGARLFQARSADGLVGGLPTWRSASADEAVGAPLPAGHESTVCQGEVIGRFPALAFTLIELDLCLRYDGAVNSFIWPATNWEEEPYIRLR